MENNSETETCIVKSQAESQQESKLESQQESKLESQQESKAECQEGSFLTNSLPDISPYCNDIIICIITQYLKVVIAALENAGAVKRNHQGEILYALKIKLYNKNTMTLNFKIIHSVSYKNIENEISTQHWNYFLFLIAGDSTKAFDSYNMALLGSYLHEKHICRVEFINLSFVDMRTFPTSKENETYLNFRKQNDAVKLIQKQNDLYHASPRFKYALNKLYYTTKLVVLLKNDDAIIIGKKAAKIYFEARIQDLLSDITETVQFVAFE